MGDVAAIIIGTGGLLIAGWSLWLAHRSQTSSYREVIFEKQIEAITCIFESLGPLFRDFTLVVKSAQHPELGQVSTELKQSVRKEREQFSVALDKYQWLLPEKMIADLTAFVFALTMPEEDFIRIDCVKLYVAFHVFMHEARSILGIDLLEHNSASVIGNEDYLRNRTTLVKRFEAAAQEKQT